MNKVFKIITNITLEQNDAIIEGYTQEQWDTVNEISKLIGPAEEYSFVDENGYILEYIITTDEAMDRIKSYGEQIGYPVESVDMTELVGEATDKALIEFINKQHGQGII
jgi:hypothetical protein